MLVHILSNCRCWEEEPDICEELRNVGHGDALTKDCRIQDQGRAAAGRQAIGREVILTGIFDTIVFSRYNDYCISLVGDAGSHLGERGHQASQLQEKEDPNPVGPTREWQYICGGM